MKKLLSLCLTLVLALTLATPALADMGYTLLNTDPEWLAWKEDWIADHPKEYAAFDPDLWFEIHYEAFDSEADFMTQSGIAAREEFEAHMVQDWLAQIQYEESQYDRAEAYAAAYPEEYAAFDPDAWVERSWYNTREGYMTMWQVDEETFVKHMWNEYAIPACLTAEAQAWVDAHPQEVDRFLDGEIEDLAVKYNYAPIAATAEDWGTSEDHVRRVLLNLWADGRLYEEAQRAEMDAFEAAHPGLLAQFEANAYDYFYQEHGMFESADAFMESMDLSEEEFIALMARVQIEEFLTREARRAEADAYKAELGGVPGTLGVMRNGKYISFPDAVPELAEGRVMVPCRPLLEAMGGTVDYDAGVVTCTLADAVLTFTLGEASLTVARDGRTETLEMDCAACAKEGRIYVPVRFAAQALGDTVLWDGDYETAVLLNLDELAADIDREFTVLNQILSCWRTEPGRAYQLRQTVRTEQTTPDGTSYGFSWTQNQLSLDGMQEGSVTIDLSGLADSYPEFTDRPPVPGEIEHISASYLANGETGDMWVKTPLLAMYDQELEQAWIHAAEWPEAASVFNASVIDMLLDQTVGASYSAQNSGSVGDYLCTMAERSVSPVRLWTEIRETAAELAQAVGDSRFVATEAGRTLTYQPEDGGEPSIVITVSEDGTVSGSYQSDFLGTTSVTTFTMTARTVSCTQTTTQAGGYESKTELTGTMHPTNRVPLSAPPAGEPVVELEDLF